MKSEEIGGFRQVNSLMVNRKSASEVVEYLGAVQAQEYALTKWGLSLRGSMSDADIENEFAAGRILRTHVLRPTWHFVSLEDIRWLLKLTAPRVEAVNAYMYRKLELDPAVLKKTNAILEKTLQGNKQLTRDILNEELAANKITAGGHRLSYIMMHAELNGLICSGGREGNQFTYTLLEERVPRQKELSHEEALQELTKRYFRSRGPATAKDFSTWSGLSVECKKGIEKAKPLLQKETVEGNEYFFIDAASLGKKEASEIFLLPIYDELIMGYKDRDPVLHYRNSFQSPPPFQYDCMMFQNGQIIGTWKRILGKKSIEIKHSFFRAPDTEQVKMFEKAVQRFSDFTGMEVEY